MVLLSKIACGSDLKGSILKAVDLSAALERSSRRATRFF